MPFTEDIPLLPADPIFGLQSNFIADPRPNKINLGIGSYKTADGEPLVLSAVKKAEQLILQKNLNKEYLPIEGDQEFLHWGLELLLGHVLTQSQSKNIFAAQTIGGANALRMIGEFSVRFVSKNIFLSQPTWSNHKSIFEKAGLKVGSYPYINPSNCLLDYEGMCHAIQHMPSGSLILLHGCCHNPTGIDPSFEQWKELSQLINKQKLIPLFDMAYQGFGQNIGEDARAIRHFVEEGHDLFIAYSFSKNFGLYGERVGFLTAVASSPNLIPKLSSQMKNLIRGNYSNPPLHGARIVSTILKSPELTIEWKTELKNMSERIEEMRKALTATLMVKGKNQKFNFMQNQKGLFSYTGLTTEQVQFLRNEKGIYMPNDGRINIAGLNTHNLPIVADALLSMG